MSVTLRSAGHIVGAAFAEIRLRDGKRERKLVMSGDIGEASPLVVRDRAPLVDADVLVMESTYGDRNHRSLADTEDELVAVMDEILHVRSGNVIVPAFALGRTQEFLVLLFRLTQAGRLRVPLVFVDSPLAAQASAVTFRHLEALDALAHAFHQAERARKLPFTLRFTESVDDSMFLNSIRHGAVIVAASGMCEAGRVRHHLRHNLPRRECGVVIIGFQAGGTLGRRLIDGARTVPALQRFRAGQCERAHDRRPVGPRRSGRADRLARGRTAQAEDDVHRARRTGGVARALGAHRAGNCAGRRRSRRLSRMKPADPGDATSPRWSEQPRLRGLDVVLVDGVSTGGTLLVCAMRALAAGAARVDAAVSMPAGRRCRGPDRRRRQPGTRQHGHGTPPRVSVGQLLADGPK